MINAPQAVLDKLKDGNFEFANLIRVNLGDAYDTGFDLILYLTDAPYEIAYGGQVYTPDNHLVEIAGISRKASTGSDSVDLVFSVTDNVTLDAVKSQRYINKPSSIDRVIIENGLVVSGFSIPVRTAWGISHEISGDQDDRSVTLTIDSSLGDLNGDNGWYAINSSHQRRYPNDLIMTHSGTVMTEDQQDRYTNNFSGVINKQNKPPALAKIYGYKNVQAVPVCMLKHRKTHTSYRHYFTTMIYVLNIGECDHIDIFNIKKGGEEFDVKVVDDNSTDVGGWSCRAINASPIGLSIEEDIRLNFFREQMDSGEKARLKGMYGKGLTLLFLKNRNRDDWLSQAPRITVPVRGSKVFDPRSSTYVYSRNPALQYADFLRSSEYGAGQRGISLADSNIAELADHFDQIPDSIGNAGINSILIDVQLDTGKPLVDNMNIWMEGVRLFTSDYYGEFNVRVETKAPVVAQVNENDLEDYPNYESKEFTERLNQLTYTVKQLVPDSTVGASPNTLIEVEVESTFPADGSQVHIDWVAEDGGIDNFETEALDYVTELEQAYYWTMVDARISRIPDELELPMGPLAWLFETGDVIEFTSEMLSMDNVTWRVQEVEDDGDITNVKLKAYDDTFYTPDPDAIPAPVSFAQPPTNVPLDPPFGFDIVGINGGYYLNWTTNQVSDITGYAVEVYRKPEVIEGVDVLVYEDPKLTYPPFLLEGITPAGYYAKVTTLGILDESVPSIYHFDIAQPTAPTIIIEEGNFSVEVSFTTEIFTAGNLFELLINSIDDFDTAQNKGVSGVFTISTLQPDTMYFLWARTVNPTGTSEWVTLSFTTLNDPASLGDFLNIDVKRLRLKSNSDFYTYDLNGNPSPTQIVFTADAAGVDTVADPIVWSSEPTLPLSITDNKATLAGADYGNHESITINIATTSGSHTDSLTILNVSGNVNNLSVKASVGFYTTNTNSQVSPSTIDFTAEYFGIDTVADPLIWSTEPSIPLSINGDVATAVSADYGSLDSVVVTVATTSGDFTDTTTILNVGVGLDLTDVNESLDLVGSDIEEINDNIYDIISETIFNTVVSQKTTTEKGANEAKIRSSDIAIANESSARATQVSQLQSNIDTEAGRIDATVVRLDSVDVDLDGNAQAISFVTGLVENPLTGLAASYQLAQSASTTADGAATSINTISNQVNDANTGLSATNTIAQSASITADDAAQAVTVISNTVNNPTTGLSATNSLAQVATTTADGAASATNVLSNSVYNESTGLTATNILAQEARQTADNNVSAVTLLQATIDDILDHGTPTSSELQLAVSGNKTEIESLQAEAYLFTNVDNRIAGIKLNSTAVMSSIEFIGDKVSFLRQDGSKSFYADIGLDEWVFDGKVIAKSGEVAGWTITDSAIYTGTLQSLDEYTVSGITLHKNGAIRSQNFRININGDVFMSGEVTARSGAIGGWAINDNGIYTGTYKGVSGFSDSGITLHKDGAIRAENFNLEADGSAKFKGELVGAIGTFDGGLTLGAARALSETSGYPSPFIVHNISQQRGGNANSALTLTFPQLISPTKNIGGKNYSPNRLAGYKRDLWFDTNSITRAQTHGGLYIDLLVSYDGGSYSLIKTFNITASVVYDTGTVPFLFRFTTKSTSWSTIDIKLTGRSTSNGDYPLVMTGKFVCYNYDESGYSTTTSEDNIGGGSYETPPPYGGGDIP